MTQTVFLHTSDWQLGKPFARIEDVQKRSAVQQERLDAIGRLAEVAREHGASFVVVSGDLFDSTTATKSTVSQACSLIGQLNIPVYAIPGNHDHGGAGSLWHQDFFTQERAQLAPNLQVLLEPLPVETEEAVLLPCPLLRRHETSDPSVWLRHLEGPGDSDGKPRIVLAHGSVLGFDGESRDENSGDGVPNLIDLSRLPEDQFDFIALGDWHGTKQVGPKAWYAGTPELDRFRKGESNDPGNVLVVSVSRGEVPKVQKVSTARLGWHQLDFQFSEDASLEQLDRQLEDMLGKRAGRDLLRLSLQGSLGIAATTRLEELLDKLRARLLRLKLSNSTTIAPSEDEIEALTTRPGDPLISKVAANLIEQTRRSDEEAAIARVALRQLHAACSSD